MLGRRSFFGLLLAPIALPLLKLVEWVKPKRRTDARDAWDKDATWYEGERLMWTEYTTWTST